jgi:Uma2 family endonuclease
LVVVKPRLSPADFVAMIGRGELNQDAFHELVDGEVIELPPPYICHGKVTMAIILALAAFAQKIGAVLVGDNVGYIVGERRQQVRWPDVALVTREGKRILPPAGHLGTAAPGFQAPISSFFPSEES